MPQFLEGGAQSRDRFDSSGEIRGVDVTGVDRVVVAQDDENRQRLDRLLASLTSVGTRRRAREAIETGKAFINGRLALLEEAGLPVPPGALCEVRWNQPGTSLERRRGEERVHAAGLRILHFDQLMVAVDKPPGLLTDVADAEQARERDSVKKRLGSWLRPQGLEALVCHRIDRDTSGVVLFACQPKAGEALRNQFSRHEPERVYLALVNGQVAGDDGVWEDTMAWDRVHMRQRIVPPQTRGASLARAWWRVVERFRGATLLEVRLDTGRRNQIRLQASHRGHPLLGERAYRNPAVYDGWGLPRQALHAWKVQVKHPTTGALIRFEAPVPADLQEILGRLRRGQAPPTRAEQGGKPHKIQRRPPR